MAVTKNTSGNYVSTQFLGHLFGWVDSNNVIHWFPEKYMSLESWSSTPNQREEIKAYRDDNTRNLTRVTAAGRKSVFSFETRENLHLADVNAIKSFFISHESNTDERKIKLAFWNEEAGDYLTGYFYRPNMAFPIKQIIRKPVRINNTNDTYVDIIYGKLSFELIQY